MRRKYTVRNQVVRGEFRFGISPGQRNDWPVLRGKMSSASPTRLAPLYDKCAGGLQARNCWKGETRQESALAAWALLGPKRVDRRRVDSRIQAEHAPVNDILGISLGTRQADAPCTYRIQLARLERSCWIEFTRH
jgi:hypothetical protein